MHKHLCRCWKTQVELIEQVTDLSEAKRRAHFSLIVIQNRNTVEIILSHV